MGIAPSRLATPEHGNGRKYRRTVAPRIPLKVREFETPEPTPAPKKKQKKSKALDSSKFCNHADDPCRTHEEHCARIGVTAGTPKKTKVIDPRSFCNCVEICSSQNEHSMRKNCQHDPKCTHLWDHVRLKQKENAALNDRYRQAREKLFGEEVAYPRLAELR